MPDVNEKAPFEAYTGDEPYIFVAYAHNDARVVFPELVRLHGNGYRIWYDEGIDPGNEWPDEVAKALGRASFFLVFISPDAVTSRNVRNEVNFALNNGKPFLAVYVADTALLPGLELRMGSIQAVMKYRMGADTYSRKMDKALPPEVRVLRDKPTPAPSLTAEEAAITMRKNRQESERGEKGNPPPTLERILKLAVAVGEVSPSAGQKMREAHGEVLRLLLSTEEGQRQFFAILHRDHSNACQGLTYEEFNSECRNWLEGKTPAGLEPYRSIIHDELNRIGGEAPPQVR
jgi:hypothetical protein